MTPITRGLISLSGATASNDILDVEITDGEMTGSGDDITGAEVVVMTMKATHNKLVIRKSKRVPLQIHAQVLEGN
ncbi:hypothetical protein KUC3_37990 [Alteromonas sp. KC3]|nr:hypothetical protein KUC3_37990 [Alteromonas sp. KC3]BCO24912.1 hypothetical protein KUC14_37810 [Alteromonas sp. KC14]